MQIECRISSLLEYFAECSLSYAKIQRFLVTYKKNAENVQSLSFFMKVCRIESLLSCRWVQKVKMSINEKQGSVSVVTPVLLYDVLRLCCLKNLYRQ